MIANPLAWWRRFVEPRSTDREEAFRERTVRVIAAILFIPTGGALLVSQLIFRDPWTLLSWPTLESLLWFLSFCSLVALWRKSLQTAAWLVVSLGLVGGFGLIVAGNNSVLAMPTFMLAVLLASLVLGRGSIIPVSLLSCVLCVAGIFVWELHTGQGNAVLIAEGVISTFFMLLPQALLLRQGRIERDQRLDALRIEIREREEARKQAEEAKQQAEHANKAKDMFLANMSHELRTPMNSVLAFVEILLTGMVSDPKEQQDLLERVFANGKRLLDLINDILDLAKIASGTTELYLMPASPRKTVTEVVDGLQGLANQRKVSLTTDFKANMPEMVVADSKKLKQIITNLVGNALKFTSEGGVTVEVGGTEDAAKWYLAVKDTGAGIPQEALAWIFDAFRQVDGSSTREHPGTGLGLSIVKGLVEMMNGTVTVHSEVDKGSTFTVTLPRYQEKLREVAPVNPLVAEVVLN